MKRNGPKEQIIGPEEPCNDCGKGHRDRFRQNKRDFREFILCTLRISYLQLMLHSLHFFTALQNAIPINYF